MRWLVVLVIGCGSDSVREPAVVAPPPPVRIDASPAWRSCLLDGKSPCLSAAPISVRHGVLAWSDWLTSFGDAREINGRAGDSTECRWVAELPNVLLCASYEALAMNAMFERAGIFIEGLQVKAGTVVKRDSDVFRSNAYSIGGYDLLKRHAGNHLDLVTYFAALDRACAQDHELCNDPAEQAMRELLERAWADKQAFVVVTFACHGSVRDDKVISHELLHGQYFTDPAFRAAIDDYWARLPEADRAEVRDMLGSVYDGGDDELMRNELQAYALMTGAQTTVFKMIVPRHRQPLLDLLHTRRIEPIQTELR
jgi:hypothetical protein